MKWPMVRLGDVAPAKSIKNSEINNPASVWLLNLDMIESNTGKVIEKHYCSIDEAGSSTHWFDEQHVLYSKLRPYLNKVVLPDALGLATTELVPILPDPKRLDRKYLYYYLRSEQFVLWINEQVAGAKMPRVSMNIFWAHEIPLPPLEEQKRIAAILDKADAIRQKRQQAIALANDFLRSVFLDMFGNMFSTFGYQSIHKKKIKQITTYIDYRGKTPEKSDSGIPLITAKNVKFGYISDEPKEFIPADNYTSWMTRGKPEAKDVLFTTEAPLGNVALLGTYEKVAIGQRIVALRPKDNIRSEYLMFSLLHPFTQGLIEARSSGSTAKGIRTKELYEIEIPLAELSKQDEFAKIYWYIISMADKISESEKISVPLTNSLSSKAFSGQL